MESHYRASLYTGIKIGGTNAEVMPGQVNLNFAIITAFHIRVDHFSPFSVLEPTYRNTGTSCRSCLFSQISREFQ